MLANYTPSPQQQQQPKDSKKKNAYATTLDISFSDIGLSDLSPIVRVKKYFGNYPLGNPLGMRLHRISISNTARVSD